MAMRVLVELSDVLELDVGKAAGKGVALRFFFAAFLRGVVRRFFEVFHVALRDDLGAFFPQDKVGGFVQESPESLEILFVQVYLVFFVFVFPRVLTELLALGNRQIVIPRFRGPHIEEIGSASGTKRFGKDFFMLFRKLQIESYLSFSSWSLYNG